MSIITDFFKMIFNLLHNFITQMGVDGNSGLSYVLAITLLTIIIRGILLPFNIKSANSSMKMQEVQPEVKKIQQKYKNDPQKAQTEVMKLYKEKDVSMTGGCLPALLPLPILMALYYTFSDMHITGSFLWISNLGKPDSWHILPILSGITTFIPSYLMTKANPQTTEGGMNMMPMNIGMSVMMAIMAYNFKSILVIYWVLGGVIQLVITYFINYKPAIKKQRAALEVAAEKEVIKQPKFSIEDNKPNKKKK